MRKNYYKKVCIKRKAYNKRRIMILLESIPRLTLTDISIELDIPISTVFDYLNEIMADFEFVGQWFEKEKDYGENSDNEKAESPDLQ